MFPRCPGDMLEVMLWIHLLILWESWLRSRVDQWRIQRGPWRLEVLNGYLDFLFQSFKNLRKDKSSQHGAQKRLEKSIYSTYLQFYGLFPRNAPGMESIWSRGATENKEGYHLSKWYFYSVQEQSEKPRRVRYLMLSIRKSPPVKTKWTGLYVFELQWATRLIKMIAHWNWESGRNSDKYWATLSNEELRIVTRTGKLLKSNSTTSELPHIAWIQCHSLLQGL